MSGVVICLAGPGGPQLDIRLVSSVLTQDCVFSHVDTISVLSGDKNNQPGPSHTEYINVSRQVLVRETVRSGPTPPRLTAAPPCPPCVTRTSETASSSRSRRTLFGFSVSGRWWSSSRVRSPSAGESTSLSTCGPAGACLESMN